MLKTEGDPSNYRKRLPFPASTSGTAIISEKPDVGGFEFFTGDGRSAHRERGYGIANPFRSLGLDHVNGTQLKAD